MSKPKDCKKCRLALSRSSIVNGDGNRNAHFAFVGEAPGREEDAAGIPFVGGAGRLLNSMLNDAGLARKDIYITNACRCRPPNNRRPEEDELEACKPFLLEELNSLPNLEVVIALGDTAASLLTGHVTNPYRGSFLPGIEPFENFKVLVTSHPARAMRERDYYDFITWDLAKLTNPPPEYKEDFLINPPDNVVEQFLTEALKGCRSGIHPFVAVDIETTGDDSRGDRDDAGLNPRLDKIVGIGFCYIPGYALHLSGAHFTRNIFLVKDFLESHTGCIFQNNRFDRAFLENLGIRTSVTWDTMTGMYLLNPDYPKKLDFLRSVYTSILPYKHAYWSRDPSIDLGTYNCRDVDVTLRVAQEQTKYTSYYLMERMCRESDIALGMMQRGICVNLPRLTQIYSELTPEIATIELDLLDKYGISVSSPKQLSEYLYTVRSLPYPMKAVKKTLISVDETSLLYAKERCVDEEEVELIDDILRYREMKKLASTYCEGLYREIQDDGRIHAWWNPEGTDTGRWACRNPNLQNVPPRMKEIFLPSPDKVLLYGDYDRIEIWIAALLAEDQTMLDLLEANVDIHDTVQKKIAEVYPTITRQQSKTILFGTFYGRSAKHIAQMYRVPVECAAEWQDIFFNAFPGLKKFFREKLVKQFELQGYLESMFGRRKYPERITQAMNFPIQSTASDILNSALIELHRRGFNIVINQHDACICDEVLDSRTEEFKEVMETAAQQIRFRFPVEVMQGANWKEFTDETKKKVKKLREAGKSTAEIHTETGVSTLALRYY